MIGKGGATVSEREEMRGVRVVMAAKFRTLGEVFKFDVSGSGCSVNILVGDAVVVRTIDVYVKDEYILSSQVGKKARVKIDKRSESGRKIVNAIIAGQEIKVFLSRR